MSTPDEPSASPHSDTAQTAANQHPGVAGYVPTTGPRAQLHGSMTTPPFSTAALLFGAVICGLGLAGVIAGTSPLGWTRSAPIGLIATGLIAAAGLTIRWRRDAPYTRAADPG